MAKSTRKVNSIFSSFSNTQPVSTLGETIELTVKPIPANWQGAWLPSELVTLSQTLSPEADTIEVGEPLTIRYQLTAVGVKPEQLPEISPAFPDSVRVYPDNDETDQYVRNGVTIAQKRSASRSSPISPARCNCRRSACLGSTPSAIRPIPRVPTPSR